MTEPLLDAVIDAFRTRCEASSDDVAADWPLFLQTVNREALLLLARRHVPSSCEIVRLALAIGIPEWKYRWLGAQFWAAVIECDHAGELTVQTIRSAPLPGRIHTPEDTRIFILGGLSRGYNRGSLVFTVGTDNQAYADEMIYLIINGCRSFASDEELYQAIVDEKWEGWEYWIPKS